MNDIDKQFLKYREHFRRFIFYNVHFQKELSEDLVQELYIKVKTKTNEGHYEERGQFRSWVTWIARNMIVDYFRKHNRAGINVISDEKYEFLFKQDITHEPSLEDNMIELEEMEWLLKVVNDCLSKMKPEIRNTFINRIYNYQSFKQIAEESGAGIGTECARMNYAKRFIKKRINILKIAS